MWTHDFQYIGRYRNKYIMYVYEYVFLYVSVYINPLVLSIKSTRGHYFPITVDTTSV